jgi:hypothetical protein
LLCPDCAPAESHSFDPAVIALLVLLATGELRSVDAAAAEPRVRRAAGTLVNSFLTYHLGKPLRAWDLVPR